MSTGSFENWAGEISEIGAIYPFVGSEFILWLIGMGLWILWHVLQCRSENKQYEEQRKSLSDPDTIKYLSDIENSDKY